MNDPDPGAPVFDQARAFYVGLNKVADALVAGKHTFTDHTYSSSIKTGAGGVVSPGGALGGIAARGSAEAGVQSNAVSDAADRSQLLAVAPSVFQDVTAHSVEAEQGTSFEMGRDYHFCGASYFTVRTHDDFRETHQIADAPRLGLWIMEIPDTQPAEQAESVTWVVLSGTAKGQIKTDLGGEISPSRGGSQTDHLFELLEAKMLGRERTNPEDQWLQDPFYAMAAQNLLSNAQRQDIEVVFMCLDVHECPTSGENAVVSYRGWGPALTDQEVAVSRVVLGTPYFVQFPQTASQVGSGKAQSLWERIKECLGI
ncbi:hypothetical protein AB0X98_07880 [Rothia koreensis]|uniref:hypothetical protein n=1 Tax=Rothia koreensis TaxID=592378 RepID=UPI003F1FC112